MNVDGDIVDGGYNGVIKTGHKNEFQFFPIFFFKAFRAV